jgi:predicted methyltransferase
MRSASRGAQRSVDRGAFAVAGRLQAIGRRVLVLESKMAGKVGRNKAAVALARKLAVAAWHVLMGHRIGAIDSEERLHSKVSKLATELGIPAIRSLGFDSKDDFIQKKLYVLKSYP